MSKLVTIGGLIIAFIICSILILIGGRVVTSDHLGIIGTHRTPFEVVYTVYGDDYSFYNSIGKVGSKVHLIVPRLKPEAAELGYYPTTAEGVGFIVAGLVISAGCCGYIGYTRYLKHRRT